MRDRRPCVYILASQARGTLYTGVTSNLPARIWQHKSGRIAGFTKRYRVHLLVWYEQHESMESAIQRERRIKEWKRIWKLKLIETLNSAWQDLYRDIC
jgi:putative endonuclease